MNNERNVLENNSLSSGTQWLFADHELDICNNPKKHLELRAHFIHSLLFNETLSIPDSVIVNTSNLRTMFLKDNELLTELTPRYLIILSRTDNNKQTNVTSLNADFIKTNRVNFHIDKELFQRDDDLCFIDNNCKTKPYEINSIAEYFSNSIKSAFAHGEYATSNIPHDHLQLFNDAINNILSEHGQITSAHIKRPGGIDKYIPRDILTKYKNIIVDIEKSTYYNAFISVHKMNSIRPPEHKHYLKVLYGDIFKDSTSEDKLTIQVTSKYLNTINLGKLSAKAVLKIKTPGSIHNNWTSTISNKETFSLNSFEEPKKLIKEYLKYIDNIIKEDLGSDAIRTPSDHTVTLFNRLQKVLRTLKKTSSFANTFSTIAPVAASSAAWIAGVNFSSNHSIQQLLLDFSTLIKDTSSTILASAATLKTADIAISKSLKKATKIAISAKNQNAAAIKTSTLHIDESNYITLHTK